MKRIGQTLVVLGALGLTLSLPVSCQRRAVLAEVQELEQYLTVPRVDEVQRATRQAVSTTGRDIQVLTLTFHTDQPVGDYREYVNDFLLARGYSQTSFLSVPGEFRLEYDGMNGNIHVIVTAEVALPPESSMTTLPEQQAPPAGEGLEGASNGDDSAQPDAVLPPVQESTPFRKITLEISY